MSRPRDDPLWHTGSFEVKAVKAQKAQEGTLTISFTA